MSSHVALPALPAVAARPACRARARALRERLVRWMLAGCLALLSATTAASTRPDVDGFWRLTLIGHQTFIFGDDFVGGGLRVPWRVALEFQVVNGSYRLGHGRAEWIDELAPYSRPAGWFDCRKVYGTYLDSNLVLHETPRVRLGAFPVAGDLRDGRVRLKPGYRSPGNYVAVTYECETSEPAANNWFGFAERGKQVLGKRQDVETRQDGDYRWVRVREVAGLPPDAQIDLPLQDGWAFERGEADGHWHVSYRLQRLQD